MSAPAFPAAVLSQIELDRDCIAASRQAQDSYVIYRVEPNGRRTLYTKTGLPRTKGWSKAVERFAQELGENLLMDSAVARKLLQL